MRTPSLPCTGRRPRTIRPRPVPGLLAAALAAALAAGCAPSGQLVAANGEHRLTAQHPASGLQVVLTTEAWDGPADVPQTLTVVHLLVANHGDSPILLAPGDFDLRDRRGFRYPLLDAGHSFQAVGPDGQPLHAGRDSYDPGASLDYRTLSSYDDVIASSALPWGVLLPGTQMRGFLYFEPVEGAANHATLTWYAQRPDHQRVADLIFDLHVARPRS